ncbi:hypothetical protein GGS21DRAFT_359771 [Xylaria nigripes]|nr:hypothetical protein GGS21DRAFT_359771 [Xylaria nigripes]
MATSREERMQQRMRGAGRHEVADDSFGFVLPVAEHTPDPSPSLPPTRSEPNTSAKRRRLNDEIISASRPSSSPSVSTRSSGLSSGQKYVPVSTVRQVAARADLSHPDSPPTTKRIAASLMTLDLNQDGTPRGDAMDITSRGLPADITMTDAPSDNVDVEMLPAPTPQPAWRAAGESSASKASDESMMDLMEEVAESPAAAPGSGRRRRIARPDAVTRSQKLQRIVMEEEEAGASDEVATSSPLERKIRRNRARAAIPRTTKTTANKTPSSPLGAIPESSPLVRQSNKRDSTLPPSSARSTRSQNRRSTLSTISLAPDAVGTPGLRRQRSDSTQKSLYDISGSEEETQQAETGPNENEANEEQVDGEEVDNEEAEEIGDDEAANRIGRKRTRVSPRQRQSPDVADPPTLEVERSTTKRKRPRQKIGSPAKQAQPKPVRRKKKPLTRRKSNGNSIPVTVQRYTKPLQRGDADTDEDILNTDIPFTDHKSPNVVDVVLQICEESIEKYLSALHEEATQADEPANRKIFRTKLRTVEAFQEELRTRLQAQTIALDHLRSLKKRVRAAQKEKVSLRNEILRIRAEREQVALKIDTVRMRHETANKETLHQLGLSSTMDDIELAIENGKMAPEPNAKELKRAELANLDLRISQIANQLGVANEGGGTLRKIKEFNTFLELAALALEGK